MGRDRIAAAFASLAAIALPFTALAQSPYPPAIVGDWTVIEEIAGDLTGDGVPEAVLLISQNDPARVLDHDGLGGPQLDLNPRALVVLSNTDGGWQQIARTDAFVPSAGSLETPCLSDPLLDGTISAQGGKLTIWYHYWLSCGSYGVTTRKYTFRFEQGRFEQGRFEQGRFRLIGFDRLEFSRSSGMGEEESINYLTSRRKRTAGVEVIGPGEGDPPNPPPIVKWDRIERELLYLDEMAIADCDDWDDWDNRPSWC